jgi:surface antigen
MKSLFKIIICYLLTILCVSCKTIRDDAVQQAGSQDSSQPYPISLLLSDLSEKSGKTFSSEDVAKVQLILENNFTYQKTEWTINRGSSTISITPTKTLQKGNLFCRQYRAEVSMTNKIIISNQVACRTAEQYWSVTQG